MSGGCVEDENLHVKRVNYAEKSVAKCIQEETVFSLKLQGKKEKKKTLLMAYSLVCDSG